MDNIFPVREAPVKNNAEKLHDYLIDRNPEGVKKVLLLHGYKATSETQMREALMRLAARGKEDAIFDLIEIHPDYELIVADYEQKQPDKTPSPKEVAPVAATPKRVDFLGSFSLDFDKCLTVFMFLVLVWLALKIFKD